jgi:predicted ATPase
MIGLSGLFTALGRFDERLPKKMDIVSRVLKNIFLLNPVPSAMRASSPLSTMLNLDGSNIAGVIAQLPARRKQMVEMKLSSYMAALTGGTLKRMWTETGIGPDAEAMFYGEGQATPGEPSTLIDALEMTDGTLRLLAILTALLTLPTRSLIAIENIGTDLTPSQVCLLLPILHEISEQRSLEVLVTTNDSSILEHLDMESYPLINLLQRHPQSAATMIMLLEEGCMPPDLMDARAMARIVARHAIQRGLVRTRKKRIVARSTVEGHMGG